MQQKDQRQFIIHNNTTQSFSVNKTYFPDGHLVETKTYRSTLIGIVVKMDYACLNPTYPELDT